MGNCCTVRSAAGDLDDGCRTIHLSRFGINVDDFEDSSEELEWAIVSNGISADELDRLRQLRDAVQDCDQHPACRKRTISSEPQTLLRYLRGREGNVAKAEVMFRAMLDWRHSFRVDEKIDQWNKELEEGVTYKSRLVRKYGVDCELCIDKYGVPVRIIRLGVADPAGMLRELGRESVLVEGLAKVERTHEQLRRAMFKHRKLLRGQVQIIDVGDYGPHGVPNWYQRMQASLSSGPDIYKVFDANYPETVRKVFFIRMGSVSRGLWWMVTPIIPERTKKKLRICGMSAQEWVDELREELPIETVLPAFLECDDDAAFATATPKGGMIPVHEASPRTDAGNPRLRGRVASTPSKTSAWGIPFCVRVLLYIAATAALGRPLLGSEPLGNEVDLQMDSRVDLNAVGRDDIQDSKQPFSVTDRVESDSATNGACAAA